MSVCVSNSYLKVRLILKLNVEIVKLNKNEKAEKPVQ